MSCHIGPDIVNDGLVFAYDMGNTQKSWKGRPTTNLYINGHFAGGQHVVQASNGAYSNPVNTVVLMDNPGSSPYCLSSTAVGGSAYTEYEMIATGLQPNTTYCMSCWFAKSADWNGTDAVFHSRWWNSDGTEQGITGAVLGTIVDTKIVNGLTWYKVYQTFTTGATTNGSHSWYAGYPSQNTTGYRYFTDFQLEVGSFPSAFANGTRSNTQAIVDQTGRSVVTTNSLTYNSDSTFNFAGGNDASTISIPLSTAFNKLTGTISMWVNPNGYSGSNGLFVNRDVSTANAVDWLWMGSWNSGNPFFFRLGDGSTCCNNDLTLSNWATYCPVGSWTYVTCSWTSAGTSKIYTNGVQRASRTISAIPSTNPSTTGRIGLGHGSPGSWNGKIGLVQIYDRQLSDAEVLINFNAQKGRYGL